MVNTAAVRLRLPASLRVHPTFHISRVKPVQESELVPLSTNPLPPPPPQKNQWRSSIYNAAHPGRGLQYLVNWVGYGPEDRLWVSRCHTFDSVTSLHGSSLMAVFFLSGLSTSPLLEPDLLFLDYTPASGGNEDRL